MEMQTEDIKTKHVNQGANVRLFRQILGMKQETLADELGVTQQKISRLEQSRVIDKPTLIQIAEILHVSPQIIQEMEENPTSIVIENNTFQAGSSNTGIVEAESYDNIINNPVEKVIELAKEHASLYERMLAIEKEKIALLEQLLNAKK